MEREESQERERPGEHLEPEDAKPGKDVPSDRDLRPSDDTERVVEKKGRETEDG